MRLRNYSLPGVLLIHRASGPASLLCLCPSRAACAACCVCLECGTVQSSQPNVCKHCSVTSGLHGPHATGVLVEVDLSFLCHAAASSLPQSSLPAQRVRNGMRPYRDPLKSSTVNTSYEDGGVSQNTPRVVLM